MIFLLLRNLDYVFTTNKTRQLFIYNKLKVKFVVIVGARV